MATVTIEGSLMPCADLPTGERRTVELTDTVRRRIANGCYVLVGGSLDDEPAAPVVEPGPAEAAPETASAGGETAADTESESAVAGEQDAGGDPEPPARRRRRNGHGS